MPLHMNMVDTTTGRPMRLESLPHKGDAGEARWLLTYSDTGETWSGYQGPIEAVVSHLGSHEAIKARGLPYDPRPDNATSWHVGMGD
jgi:hypothetical protein